MAEPVKNYNISNGQDMIDLAVDLAKFIKDNKLYQNIQGKEYVNVEGWQYAGARLGIVPVLKAVNNIGTPEEVKYNAAIDLIDIKSGLNMGGGFAVCSNKEQGKKYYQEYAIASMAQTRAVGKAYRNLLSYLIRLAGYEPTPAEEMDTAPAPAEAAPAEGLPITMVYATEQQKKTMMDLIKNPKVTKEEHDKMLPNINKLDKIRANEAIAKLKKTITERGGVI